MKSLLGSLGLGLITGVLSGLVGIGGGIIIVPALVYFFSMDEKTAQGGPHWRSCCRPPGC